MNDAISEVSTDVEPPDSWWNRAWTPCDISSIVVLRVVFAVTVLSHIFVFFSRDGINYFFGRPQYNLTYFGFEWVQPLGPDGMRRIFYLMGGAAIGVGLGLLYRLSATVLFLTFTYTFLCEAALFQNHYYLMSLTAMLLILIPAHRWYSVDAILVPHKASPWIPNWCRWLLMFQIGMPYFYGGLAKIDWDWLHGMPALFWFPQQADTVLIGPLLAYPATAWFISYFGLVFDLLVVPLLLWRPTRIWAFAMATCFHLTNAILFNIDVFPWMMIPATTIFFSADWPRKVLRLKQAVPVAAAGSSYSLRKSLVMCFVFVYLAWQVLFPFRHWAYPGNPSWTDEGQQFAWRMMLRHKLTFSVFYATDANTGRMVEVPLPKLMASRQIYDLTMSPDQIVACAPFLASWAQEEYGFEEVEIRAFVLTSLNGRKPQFLVDPDLDLLSIDRSIWPQPGIMPLTEPLRSEAWDVPVHQWLDELDISLPVSVPRVN